MSSKKKCLYLLNISVKAAMMFEKQHLLPNNLGLVLLHGGLGWVFFTLQVRCEYFRDKNVHSDT